MGPKSRETHLSVELGCAGQLRGQTRASGEENGELPGAAREQPRRVTRPGFPARPDGTAIFTEGSSGTSPPQRGKFENHAGRRDLGRASRGKARNGRARAVGCSQSQLPPPPTAILTPRSCRRRTRPRPPPASQISLARRQLPRSLDHLIPRKS